MVGNGQRSKFHQPYTALVYQPILEVMDYLLANGFKTYIVTGGGQEFVRVYSQSVYGIRPEPVVRSSILTKYEYQDGKPVLMREPKVFFIDDNAGKPARRDQPVHRQAAVRRVWQFAGLKQMLGWTQAGAGSRLMMWSCMMIPYASTHTVPPLVYRTPKSVPSRQLCTMRPTPRAGTSSTMKND